MKIKSLFFKVPEPKLKTIKNVTVYISEKYSEIIIAPIFKDTIGGYSYEQEVCEKLDLNTSYEKIGETIKVNFNKFDIKKNKKEKHNKSDWPAFKLSREKTITGFEKYYKRFSISGVNEYNTILTIETVSNNLHEIELTTSISFHCDNAELGKRIMKLFNSEVCYKSNI